MGVKSFFLKSRKYVGLPIGLALRKPLVVTWQATYGCNLRCKICNYWKMKADFSRELKVKEYEIAVPKISDLGVKFVVVGGGEPFLRPDLEEIIGVLSRHFFVGVVTNGTLIDRRRARKTSRVGVTSVFVSLDYPSPEDHDKQRGVRGTFDRALKSIACLKEEFLPWQLVGIETTLLRNNLDQIEELVGLARELGVKIHFSPYSDIKTGDKLFGLNSSEQLEKIMRLKHLHPDVVISSYAYLKGIMKFVDGDSANCKAGKYLFNIDSWGNIARCVEELGKPIAHAISDSEEEIKKALSSLKETSCTKCYYSCRGETETVFSNPIGKILGLVETFLL